MNRLDSYTPLGYSLCGVVVEVGAGAERVRGRPAWSPAPATSSPCTPRSTGCRPTCACRCPTASRPSTPRSPRSGAIAMQGVRRGRGRSSARPRASSASGWSASCVVQLLVAAGVQVVGLDTVDERCRLAEAAGALRCAAPDDDGVADVEQVARRAHRRPRRRPRLPRRRRRHQRPGRARRPARPGPGPRRRHRQDAPRPAVERVLREGARRPLLALVRARALRRPLRARGRRLPGRATCAGPSGATWRASSTCSPRARLDVDLARLGHAARSTTRPTVYEQLRDGRAARASGFLFEYPADASRGRAHAAPAGRHRGGPAGAARRPAARPTPTVRLGFIGAGNYATSMLLPHLARARRRRRSRRWPRRVAVGAQRAAQVRLRATTTDADDGPRRRRRSTPSSSSPGTTRTPASSAGPSSRQGRVRREAAGPRPSEQLDGDPRRRSSAPATTGSWSASTGASRRCSSTCASASARRGGPVSAATSSTPAGWRPAAGTSTSSGGLALRRRGRPLRRHRSAGGSGTTRSRCTPSAPATGRPAGDAALSRRVGRHDHLRHRRRARASPRRRSTSPADGRNARLDNFAPGHGVDGRGGRDTKRSLTGQDKGQRPELDAFVEAVRLGAAMPIALDSLVATTRATLAVGESLRLRAGRWPP